MTFLFKQLFSFFRMLNSETGTSQIASGLALGIVLGFSPFLSLQTFLVLFFVVIFRVQLGAVFLSAFFFKLIAYLLDPVCDRIGRLILEADSLRPLWIILYNAPLVPLTRFNNSIVMGSGVLGFLLCIPAYFLFTSVILHYRTRILAKLQATNFWRALRATRFVQWYLKYEDLYGR